MRTSSLLLGFLLAIGCGKKADPTPQGPQGTGTNPGLDTKNNTGTDEDFAQGYWTLVAVDHPDGDTPPVDALKQFAFTVKGDVVMVQDQRRIQYFTFKADTTKSPKEVDFFEADKTGKPLPVLDRQNVPKGERPKGPFGERFLGIYKVEGDTITVAVVVDGEPGIQPKEFKSIPPKERKRGVDPAIVVLTLKKTTQAPPKIEPSDLDNRKPVPKK